MKRILIAALTAVLVSACATKPKPQEQSQTIETGVYTSQPGHSPVGVIPAGSIRDTRRNKDLEVSIEYPTKGGPHPVIIFSHGYGSSARAYVGLSSYWSSHGYVVIKPSHADAGKLRLEELRDPTKITEQTTPADWRNRVEDIGLILDSFQTLEQQYPELQGKMDANRIAVGGHSYGAFTAMLIGGVRTFSGGASTSYADPRVKAVLAMSPQGPSESRGLTAESWKEVRIPVLYMTGSNDRGTNDTETAEWRRQAFELSPAGDKWFVSIAGANHFTFTGGFRPVPTLVEPSITPMPNPDPRYPRTDPAQTSTPVPRRGSSTFIQDRNVFNTVKSISLAFWDTYLKNEPKGREYLTKLSTRGDVAFASQ